MKLQGRSVNKIEQYLVKRIKNNNANIFNKQIQFIINKIKKVIIISKQLQMGSNMEIELTSNIKKKQSLQDF